MQNGKNLKMPECGWKTKLQVENTIEQARQENEINNINQTMWQEETFEENETFVSNWRKKNWYPERSL